MSTWDAAEREVDAELEFHLAEATDELVAAGVPREEARERALAQLGGIERWRADCLRHRKGRKTMLVKLQWAAIAALVLALGFLGFRTTRARQAQELEIASLRAELAAERQPASERGLVERTAEVLRQRIQSGGLASSSRVRMSRAELAEGQMGHIRFEPSGTSRMIVSILPNGDLEVRNGSIQIDPEPSSGSDRKR